MANILVTGGAGYIGSHTCVELLQNGHDVTVADHLGNSRVAALDPVRNLTGKPLRFVQGDLRDPGVLDEIFSCTFDAVVHFAGWKAVGESVVEPLKYYTNNLDTTLALCARMEREGVRRLVFSSSATVYRTPAPVPIREDAPLWANSPYGWTKFMNEQILRDLSAGKPGWSVLMLRYFNPAGAHPSGQMGEDPDGIPNNLMPYITQVAVGKRDRLTVHGADYPTSDGTGIRDYIHVTDLASGHLRAVDLVLSDPGTDAVNLGTGRGYSVLEVIRCFEETNKVQVPYIIGPRRPGDVAVCYADPSYAGKILNWQAEKELADMCRDAWRWQRQHPSGYNE